MPDPLDRQIIDRYLAGEATPAEHAEVEAHRAQDPAWVEAIDVLHSKLARREPGRWDTDGAWSRVRSRLDTERRAAAARNDLAIARRRTMPARRWLLAAGLVLAAGTAVWRASIAWRASGVSEKVAMNEIATPNGARNTLTLDDGSRVTLNAGSRLRWAPDFGARARDVYLEGEAYFVVTHDRARPFRVHARDAVAHDLGTRFTVRAYPELAGLEVVVAEGSVSLRREGSTSADSAILTTGQLGRLGASGPPTVERGIAVERWTAWTSGSLVLHGQTLAETVPELERWYDATFTISDPRLAARRVSARFHDETLTQMLDALSLALGARWQQTGRSITLSPIDR